MNKYKGKTQYSHVYELTKKDNTTVYRFMINRRGKTINKLYPDIRQCAIAADKWLINNGEEPVNILKRKSSE